jgi:putative acetyltransferase
VIFEIKRPAKESYFRLAEIWEASVRATHHFIPETYILQIRPLLLDQYFDQLDLYTMNGNSEILGFCGIYGDKIEMLFIHPDWFGKGAGTQLVKYAINQLGAIKVDVNEQNRDAFLFYKKLGFAVESRSETDGAGKPYPILHLSYQLVK